MVICDPSLFAKCSIAFDLNSFVMCLNFLLLYDQSLAVVVTNAPPLSRSYFGLELSDVHTSGSTWSWVTINGLPFTGVTFIISVVPL